MALGYFVDPCRCPFSRLAGILQIFCLLINSNSRSFKEYKAAKDKKRTAKRAQQQSKGPGKKRSRLDHEEVESDSDVESGTESRRKVEYESSSDSEEETAQEKKLRLAKEYLSQIEREEAEKREDDEIHKDIISHRLKQDLLEQTGRLQKQVADNYTHEEDRIIFRGHQLSVTCTVISPDNRYVFSASKDCSVIKWDVANRKRMQTIHGGLKGTEQSHTGHTSHVLCMALSSDGKYLATGDRNKLIFIWNPDTLELIHKFTGHRDAVSGLAFRKGTHQLFSASLDRSVKIWSVDERAYVETLFGHQDSITAVDSLTRDRAVTSGGRDGSIRVWKVVEESQLVFHGHCGSIDCVALINESNFISGADNNSLALWSLMKKKPIAMCKNAHGRSTDENHNGDKSEENWITAVAAFTNTDLVASAIKANITRVFVKQRDIQGEVHVIEVDTADTITNYDGTELFIFNIDILDVFKLYSWLLEERFHRKRRRGRVCPADEWSKCEDKYAVCQRARGERRCQLRYLQDVRNVTECPLT
ncbi:hypothetical protein FSP39_004378 [Pinctada imbricata]|uniref:U3 small nucleolar RNA-interacting protein 2 n=1 Tax=Pinctada imbricata TaxID=66713 RepID=A0AA88YHJ6_PINIB|nr:hypothetical protein FSP39_004378 [Pinctada imbricata]